MSFRDMFREDLKNVFHNLEEFAREYEIGYDGEYLTVNAVLTEAACQDRGQYDGRQTLDYRLGVYPVIKKLYVQRAELGFLPSVNSQIEIDGDIYDIMECDDLDGEIVMELRRYDH